MWHEPLVGWVVARHNIVVVVANHTSALKSDTPLVFVCPCPSFTLSACPNYLFIKSLVMCYIMFVKAGQEKGKYICLVR